MLVDKATLPQRQNVGDEFSVSLGIVTVSDRGTRTFCQGRKGLSGDTSVFPNREQTRQQRIGNQAIPQAIPNGDTISRGTCSIAILTK